MHSSAGDLAALLDADLANNGWDGSVEPYPGISGRQYAFQSLRKSLLKKFHNNEVQPDCDKAALSKFTQVNSDCASYREDVSHVDELLWTAIGEAKSFLDRFCNPEGLPLLTLAKIERGVAFGRGANIGAKTGDPYGKLGISRLTYTDPALLVLFKHTLDGRSLWIEQEQFRSKNYPTSEVQGSRLSFVPKSSEISRTICTEPILNMYFQKGIGYVLEKRLREVINIDLSTQPQKNRALCRIGSLTGRFGTIDLSSASDSMSCTLVKQWFPDHFVRWLDLTRCKQTILPDGSALDLHMISSMGNAFTFPLQTIFFTSLVVGAYRALDLKVEKPRGDSIGNFAVFGDDIIVLQEAYNLVVRMLSFSGFTVNYDKSFNTGLFRESCGHDYYDGHNVRGVYLRKLLDDHDCYSAFNRLVLWSARNEVVLDHTLTYLMDQVSRRLVVPLHEDDEAGFKVPLYIIRQRLARNRRFQSFNYVAARRRSNILRMPQDQSDVKAIWRLKRAIPGWSYNPAGLLLLLLHGSIRDGQVTLRLESSKTEYRKRHSSCWDYSDYDGPERAAIERRYFDALAAVIPQLQAR
jgi:hypothetical protein